MIKLLFTKFFISLFILALSISTNCQSQYINQVGESEVKRQRFDPNLSDSLLVQKFFCILDSNICAYPGSSVNVEPAINFMYHFTGIYTNADFSGVVGVHGYITYSDYVNWKNWFKINRPLLPIQGNTFKSMPRFENIIDSVFKFYFRLFDSVVTDRSYSKERLIEAVTFMEDIYGAPARTNECQQDLKRAVFYDYTDWRRFFDDYRSNLVWDSDKQKIIYKSPHYH